MYSRSSDICLLRQVWVKLAFIRRSWLLFKTPTGLDAIGAIGIARAFSYGGFKGREIYDPEVKPDLHMTKEAYKNSTAPTINHFYEKLLLLKDKMNTETGKKMAEQRHAFMESYLDQFYSEC